MGKDFSLGSIEPSPFPSSRDEAQQSQQSKFGVGPYPSSRDEEQTIVVAKKNLSIMTTNASVEPEALVLKSHTLSVSRVETTGLAQPLSPIDLAISDLIQDEALISEDRALLEAAVNDLDPRNAREICRAVDRILDSKGSIEEKVALLKVVNK